MTNCLDWHITVLRRESSSYKNVRAMEGDKIVGKLSMKDIVDLFTHGNEIPSLQESGPMSNKDDKGVSKLSMKDIVGFFKHGEEV